MGDHRASITIIFEAHGVEEKHEFWINYWPEPDTGVDRRITDWLSSAWQKCLDAYHNNIDEGIEERRAQEKKARRLQYETLRAEFEPIPPKEPTK
jgi:hypothetical protein